jgi:hypothetical protein
MRRPRLRFTVRRISLVVAVVATFLSCGTMIARSRNFNRQAIDHAALAEQRRTALEARAGDVDPARQNEKDCLKQARSSPTRRSRHGRESGHCS